MEAMVTLQQYIRRRARQQRAIETEEEDIKLGIRKGKGINKNTYKISHLRLIMYIF
jgi:hypothetical protein